MAPGKRRVLLTDDESSGEDAPLSQKAKRSRRSSELSSSVPPSPADEGAGSSAGLSPPIPGVKTEPALRDDQKQTSSVPSPAGVTSSPAGVTSSPAGGRSPAPSNGMPTKARDEGRPFAARLAAAAGPGGAATAVGDEKGQTQRDETATQQVKQEFKEAGAAAARQAQIKREGSDEGKAKSETLASRARAAGPSGAPRGPSPSPARLAGSVSPAPKKKLNKYVKTEENFEPINRWWERTEAEIEREQEKQWSYLEHNGLMFAPPYEPHGIAVKYKGETVALPPDAEEVANFWCGVLESDYATKTRFIENFWKAFLRKLPRNHPILRDEGHANAKQASEYASGEPLSGFAACDFSPIKEYLDKQKELKKEMTKEEKEVVKQQKLQEAAPYAYALVDFIREKVGNTRVEPPGLFRGRGEHPKQGMLKRRIFSEDVILNLAEDAPVPRVALPGHAWKDVFHDNSVTWLAFYRDSINDQVKYMYLAAQSKFKGQQDFLKYEKARKLKLHVDRIRQDYFKKMESANSLDRQLGTATYLIDFLALRVGGEKDTDEEADTVGCCSLRVEHLTFDTAKQEVTFDFLGKDSIRYFNTVKIHPQAFKNIVGFCKGKKPEDDVFDKINSAALNNHLRQFMPGLSAKVFRTYNASITLQNELYKLDQALALRAAELDGKPGAKKAKKEAVKMQKKEPESDDEDQPLAAAAAKENPQEETEEERRKREEQLRSITCNIANVGELIQFYNDANRAVAILCNHQRSVPKQHAASMQKMEHQQLMLEEDIRECEAYLAYLKKPASKKKEHFSFASDVKDFQGNPRKAVVKDGMKEDVCARRLQALLKRRADHLLKIKLKDDNKTVALGTSKINYMDPRITVAFCKKYEVPIEKLFNKSLRLKFPWAMFAKSSFEF
ncbi:putative DNA topoisomerase I [Besnoitia besnoiti]|uniref:DNA topoisomerase 1 n=1 Tax=Besnoitia besnoiti TaxID=94643 RepID=A0A2A9MK87_BESBE|nr:putative DNA topoisomerase I [Besnoitia besnoiti]PFH35822.1 putative DNA topoisomerase I [Besnoitia besnoiti]